MKLIIKLMIFSILVPGLTSCGAFAPKPTETPVPTATSLSTLTSSPEPTATPTPEPSPTPDPLLFRDDFEEALGEGWQWVREDPKT